MLKHIELLVDKLLKKKDKKLDESFFLLKNIIIFRRFLEIIFKLLLTP
jgi:hypothetical protein